MSNVSSIAGSTTYALDGADRVLTTGTCHCVRHIHSQSLPGTFSGFPQRRLLKDARGDCFTNPLVVDVGDLKRLVVTGNRVVETEWPMCVV